MYSYIYLFISHNKTNTEISTSEYRYFLTLKAKVITKRGFGVGGRVKKCDGVRETVGDPNDKIEMSKSTAADLTGRVFSFSVLSVSFYELQTL